MAITAKDVNALRQRTGMGMMECKKALTEADGDTEKAVALLREWAGGKMDDRGDRAASEGVIAASTSGGAASGGAATIVMITAETDFAARNEQFVANAQSVADQSVDLRGTGDVTGAATEQSKTLVEDLRLTIKENIALKSIVRLEGKSFGVYVHTNRKSGAIVAFDGPVDPDLAKGLAMHVTAAVPPVAPAPLAVDADGLPAEQVEAAKKQFVEEAQATGKPAEIAEKIAAGKMKKWQDENTLLGQTYIRELDAKKPVRDYLPKGVKVTGFQRLAVG